jgi:MFS family permease
MKNSTTGIEQADNLAATGSGRGVLVVVCIAMFSGVLNASAVGAVLPEIASVLSAETAQIGWLMDGLLLVYGIAIPFYGRLADR